MTTTASSAANSSSLISHYSSIDSSMSRSRRDSSPWMGPGDSVAIHDHPASSVSQEDHFLPPGTRTVSPPTGKETSDNNNNDNADKKPVWNKPSTSSSEVGPVMGAASWPALAVSARASSNKSPSLESFKGLSDGSSSSAMQAPQATGTPPNSTSNANTGSSVVNANTGSSVVNANTGSSVANANAGSSVAATSSENHTVNGQRRPFRRNNNNNYTSSSSSNISNPPNAVAPAPLNNRDQNHSQRGGGGGGSYGSGPTQFRNSYRNRNNNNNNSYPRGDGFHHGNRRNYEHGNQSGFSHHRNNYNGRDMHLQPQRGFGVMRPQMMMGPPSFPASSAQYMAAATQIGSYGGPMLYQDYAPHMIMPHQPPDAMGLVGVGQFPPLPMYFPSPEAILYSRIRTQVEYYFSADNLSRDQYLRGCMNDEGWVPVRIIAGFKRLAEVTNNIQTILEALRSSEVVEVKGETVRRRGDWDKYLLPRASASSNNASLGSQLESLTLSES